MTPIALLLAALAAALASCGLYITSLALADEEAAVRPPRTPGTPNRAR